MTGSIVCGVDGSPDAVAALRVGAQLAEQLDARLVVAHVTRPPQPVSVTPLGGMPQALATHVDAQLRLGERVLEQTLVDPGLDGAELADVERRVLYGIPADRLADLADEEEAMLIVVGSRGRGAFRAAFLGSVSSELIGVARCPVLVVPPGAVEALI